MPSSKREAKIPRALCAELHPDDGADPREDKKRKIDRGKGTERKLRQLCKQVSNILQLAISGLDLAAEARIQNVEPAPNAGRLRVTVAITDIASRSEVEVALTRRAGFLRREVAHAVVRHRVPELIFSIIAEGPADA